MQLMMICLYSLLVWRRSGRRTRRKKNSSSNNTAHARAASFEYIVIIKFT